MTTFRDRMEGMADEFDESPEFQRQGYPIDNFLFDSMQEKYWCRATGRLLGEKGVNAEIPRDDWVTVETPRGDLRREPPSKTLMDVRTGLTVESATWWPGEPQMIDNLVVTAGGAIEAPGKRCFNRYRQPRRREPKRDQTPDMWLQHIRRLFPDPLEVEHFLDYCAHMMQRPEEKCNHGVVIAGTQGIGKDLMLLPLREGVGVGNIHEIDPDDVKDTFNPYRESVMLVVNEVRPHDAHFKASDFYGKMKPLLAAPPLFLPVNDKNTKIYYIRNITRVFFTTNDPATMYVPDEDRRLFVMTSPVASPAEFPEGYFKEFARYLLEQDGCCAVVDFLLSRDISEFNPAAPPPITDGKRSMMSSSRIVRENEVDDVIHEFRSRMGGELPDVFFAADLVAVANAMGEFDNLEETIRKIKSRGMPHKVALYGYRAVQHPQQREWEVKSDRGRFRARVAYVKNQIRGKDIGRAVEAAVALRPLSFEPAAEPREAERF